MSKEKIEKVEIYKADLGLKEPFRTSLAEISTAENIIVRVYTGAGLYGTGEARPNPVVTGETQATAFAAAPALVQTLLGQNPSSIETLVNAMERKLKKNSAVKSAIDMALFDLKGKIVELPVYSLLGGTPRPLFTDNTVSLSAPEEMVAKAKAHVEEGYQAIKVKLGGEKHEDISRIKQIRGAIGGDIALRLDANQGWDYKTAVYILKALEPYEIQYCEQPLVYWDAEHMRRLRDTTSIPVMADETLFSPQDAFKLASEGSCDYFNIKLTKSGGITNGEKINTIAEAAGIPCMIGCMTETRLAMSASAHLMAARPNIWFADLDGYTSMKADPVLGGVRYEAGDMSLPEAPGHGADFDPEFLRACEVVTIG